MTKAAFSLTIYGEPGKLPAGADSVIDGLRSLEKALDESSTLTRSDAETGVDQNEAEGLLSSVSKACGPAASELQANLHRILVSLEHTSAKVKPRPHCIF